MPRGQLVTKLTYHLRLVLFILSCPESRPNARQGVPEILAAHRTGAGTGVLGGRPKDNSLFVGHMWEPLPDIEAFQSMNHAQNTDCVLALPACCPYLAGPRRSNRLRFGTVAKELSACAQPLAKHASASLGFSVNGVVNPSNGISINR